MKVAIVTGGSICKEFVEERLKSTSYDEIIAVDRGAEFFLESHFFPGYIVGDFDSIAPGILETLQQKHQTKIERHSSIKDETDTERCDFTTVPAYNLTLTASFESDSGLVAGTAVAIIVVALLAVFLVIVVVILAKVTRRVKKENKFVELETLKEIDEDEELVEERILKQVEAIRIATGIKEKLAKSLKKADRNKGVGEILADLEVECDESKRSGDVVESFQTSSVSAAVASAFYNRVNLAPAAEYLALLYTTVRDQEEFEEFEGFEWFE